MWFRSTPPLMPSIQHIEAPNRQATPRKVRDNTLKHLEYPSPPSTFYIYFRGQPGINFQALLSKRRFEYSETPLGQLINFKAVNPPICFKVGWPCNRAPCRW